MRQDTETAKEGTLQIKTQNKNKKFDNFKTLTLRFGY